MRLELCFVLVLLFVSIDTCCGLRSTAGLAFRPQSLHVLNFMTASVTDLVLPSPTSTEYKIKEASFSDLGSIVSLRVNVFYPELKSVVRYAKSDNFPLILLLLDPIPFLLLSIIDKHS